MTTELQHDALLAADVEAGALYEDKVSGKREDRPQLLACPKALRAYDTLIVWKLAGSGGNCATWSTSSTISPNVASA